MWGRSPPKDNLEAWVDIHAFIAAFPDDEYWSRWKPMVEGVVSNLEARGLAPLFRVGQSMHHVIFSTIDHHNLTDEPRVTLEFLPNRGTVRVAYCYANLYFQPAIAEVHVPVSDAVPIVLDYLRRLWIETKPSVPLPSVLGRDD